MLSFSLKDILSFFVDFEHAISQEAAPGVMFRERRNVPQLLKLFKAFSNCEYILIDIDLSEPASDQDQTNIQNLKHHAHEIESFVLNFGAHAEIYINTMLNGNGEPLVNQSGRRFCAIKEAFHVILRDAFIRNNMGHPDTKNPEELQTTIEKMVFLPFSINDLDNPQYSESERVEHAAELLSLLMLYPLDCIALDRQEFLRLLGASSFDDDNTIITDTGAYAKSFMVPQRYVDLIFRWSNFDEIYEIYCQLKEKNGYN